MNKDVRQLIKRARRQGFTVGRTRRHVVLADPATGKRVTLPSTPSDHRWRANALAELRRIGFNAHA